MNLKNIPFKVARSFCPRRMVILGLVLLTLATFWRVRNLDFINLDDNIYVYDNPHIRDGLTWEGVQWAFGADLLFSTKNADYWQPVTFLSRMLDIQLFGMNPAGHHLMNLLFHLFNTLLLFHVLQKMTGHIGRSAMAAALFAVHPLHVEAVAWVTERKDVLSGFFWMLTLWAYGKYSSHRTHRSTRVWGWYLLVIFFFALGLMSKPMVVTLPFVLLLLDFWPLNRIQNSEFRIKNIVLEKVPLITLSLLSIVITFPYQGQQLRSSSLWVGFENSMVSYGIYLVKTAWPHPLAVFYPKLPGSPPMGQFLGSGILLIMITLLAVRWRRSFPFLLVGWSWFLGTLVPVINLSDITGADRFTYLPLIGLFIPLVWGAAEAMDRSRFMALGGTTVGVCAILSFHQLGYWKNSVFLLEHAVSVTTQNVKTLNNLGVALLEAGREKEALERFNQALQVDLKNGEVHSNRGIVLAFQGNQKEALRSFQKAIQNNPDNPAAYSNLGGLLGDSGNLDEAIKQLERAIRVDPDFAEAHANLGRFLSQKGNWEGAIHHYRQALRINPGSKEVINNLGYALLRSGRTQEALQLFIENLKSNPDFAEGWFNFGNALVLQDRIKDAKDCFQQAVRFDPNYALAHYNLGICMSRLNDSQGAIRHLRKAVSLKPDFAPWGEELKRLERTGKKFNSSLNPGEIPPNPGTNASQLPRR